MDDANNKRVMTQPEKVEHIISGFCEYFGLSPDDLARKSGSKSKIWEKKRYAIVLLRDNTILSYPEIAEKLGYKTNVNALYHYKQMKEELSGEIYGSERTRSIYNELLTYLKL